MCVCVSVCVSVCVCVCVCVSVHLCLCSAPNAHMIVVSKLFSKCMLHNNTIPEFRSLLQHACACMYKQLELRWTDASISLCAVRLKSLPVFDSPLPNIFALALECFKNVPI